MSNLVGGVKLSEKPLPVKAAKPLVNTKRVGVKDVYLQNMVPLCHHYVPFIRTNHHRIVTVRWRTSQIASDLLGFFGYWILKSRVTATQKRHQVRPRTITQGHGPADVACITDSLCAFNDRKQLPNCVLQSLLGEHGLDKPPFCILSLEQELNQQKLGMCICLMFMLYIYIYMNTIS